MFLLAAAFVIATPWRASAQVERYAPLILQLPSTARSLGLGGAVTAMREAESAFGNPALVGGTNTFSLSVGRYQSGATTGHIATTMLAGTLGIGVGVRLLDAAMPLALFPARSDVLTTEGNRAVSSMAATLSASTAWKGLRVGVAAKYVEERTGGMRDAVLAADIGLSRDFRNGSVNLSLVAQNLGPALHVAGERAQLPQRLALGLAGGNFRLGRYFDLNAAMHVIVRRDGLVRPAGGLELMFVPIEGVAFAMRGGARAPELLAQRGATLGAGVTFERMTLDFAWEDMRGDGGAHRVSLRVR